MSRELVDLSISYLSGWKSINDLAEWLAGIDWNNPGLDPESLAFAGLMELLVTEVAEGLRPEADLWQEASKFVEGKTGSLYAIQASTGVANSSNDTTNLPIELKVMAGVGVGVGSQSWSISPLSAPS